MRHWKINVHHGLLSFAQIDHVVPERYVHWDEGDVSGGKINARIVNNVQDLTQIKTNLELFT